MLHHIYVVENMLIGRRYVGRTTDFEKISRKMSLARTAYYQRKRIGA